MSLRRLSLPAQSDLRTNNGASSICFFLCRLIALIEHTQLFLSRPGITERQHLSICLYTSALTLIFPKRRPGAPGAY